MKKIFNPLFFKIKSQLKSTKELDKNQSICTVREINYYNSKLNKFVYNRVPFELGQIDKENHTPDIIGEY